MRTLFSEFAGRLCLENALLFARDRPSHCPERHIKRKRGESIDINFLTLFHGLRDSFSVNLILEHLTVCRRSIDIFLGLTLLALPCLETSFPHSVRLFNCITHPLHYCQSRFPRFGRPIEPRWLSASVVTRARENVIETRSFRSALEKALG